MRERGAYGQNARKEPEECPDLLNSNKSVNSPTVSMSNSKSAAEANPYGNKAKSASSGSQHDSED